jgi:hypothetical protein
MQSLRYSKEEISQRGRQWYEQSIRPQIDEEANRGRPLIIDIETGDYEIGDDSLAVSKRMLAKHPGAMLYGMRIGYPSFAKAGGGWRFDRNWPL